MKVFLCHVVLEVGDSSSRQVETVSKKTMRNQMSLFYTLTGMSNGLFAEAKFLPDTLKKQLK